MIKYLLPLLISFNVYAVDNAIDIDQIGDSNTVAVTQQGQGHKATVVMGKISAVDYTTVNIEQRDSGTKTATVEIKSGSNNGANILQQGAGNHTASIQNLTGQGNNIIVTQQGSGSHEFTVTNGAGTTNTGNTINATQSGNVGSEKWFNVGLNGATGANVTINQGGSGPDQSSMNIQCAPGTCGSWTWTRY